MQANIIMNNNQSNDKAALILDNFIAVLNYLKSRWLIIVFIGILGGIAGIVYAWMKSPLYTAEMTFTSENERGGGGGQLNAYAGIASQFGIDIGSSSNNAFEGDNLIELIKSRNIIEKTLYATNTAKTQLLIDDYILNHKMRDGWKANSILQNLKFEKSGITPNRLRDSITREIYTSIVKKQLIVERVDKKLSYISIKFTDTDENFAENFVNQLSATAIQYYVEYKSRKLKANFEIIRRQTDSVKTLLFGNIETTASVNDLNLNPSKQAARTGSQKSQINTTVNSALYTELVKQLGISQLTLQKETPLIQIIDKPIQPLKKEKLGRLMTGIIFSILFGIIAVAFLSIKKWIQLTKNNTLNISA
jgi:uncharacterized protein involved in exopolysaccharide biosynthesis